MGAGKLFHRAIPQATAAPAEQHRSLAEFQAAFLLSSASWGRGPYRGALAIPGAWRAATLLSGLIGELPWHAFEDDPATGIASRLYPTPPILEDPAAGVDTRITFTSGLVLDLLMEGNGVAVVAGRNEAGWPTAFVAVPVCQVGIRYTDNAYALDALGRITDPVEYRIGDHVFGARDVLHVKGPCPPGSLRGLSVIEVACGAFALARDLDEQAGNVARNAVPTGLLKAVTNTNIAAADLQAAADAWRTSQEDGPTINALAPGLDFVPLSWNPEERQLIEARLMSTSQMALLFGLPGSFLNVESGSLNYSNIGADGLHLLKFSMNQLLVRIEQALDRHLPPGIWSQANRDAILRTDTKSRYESYGLGISAGWLLKSEARALEDLAEVPGIDDASPAAVPAEPGPATEPPADMTPTEPDEPARSAEPITVNLTVPETRPQVRIVRVGANGVRGADPRD